MDRDGAFVVLSPGIVAVIVKYCGAKSVRVAVERRLNDGLDAVNCSASFDAWVERIHPDDCTAGMLETWEAAIDNKSVYACEYRDCPARGRRVMGGSERQADRLTAAIRRFVR